MKTYFKIQRIRLNENMTQSDWVEDRAEEFPTLEAARAASPEYTWKGIYDASLGDTEARWPYRKTTQHLLAVDSGSDSAKPDSTPVRIIQRWAVKS